jgi:hypothetical protein
VLGANIVGPTKPSGTTVPMIFRKSIKPITTSFQVLNSSPKWRHTDQLAKIYLGGDPIFNQGRYVNPNKFSTSCLSHLNKRKQQKYLLRPCSRNFVYISSLWKWWIVAMSKLCKNLMYNLLLYEHLNSLVYFEMRAWNKTLWEENAYDQTVDGRFWYT